MRPNWSADHGCVIRYHEAIADQRDEWQFHLRIMVGTRAECKIHALSCSSVRCSYQVGCARQNRLQLNSAAGQAPADKAFWLSLACSMTATSRAQNISKRLLRWLRPADQSLDRKPLRNQPERRSAESSPAGCSMRSNQVASTGQRSPRPETHSHKAAIRADLKIRVQRE